MKILTLPDVAFPDTRPLQNLTKFVNICLRQMLNRFIIS